MNDRAAAIAAYAAKLREHREEIVALLIQETGKVNGNAEYDFDMLPNCKYLLPRVELPCALRRTAQPSSYSTVRSTVTVQPCGILVGVRVLASEDKHRTALPCVRPQHAPKPYATPLMPHAA